MTVMNRNLEIALVALEKPRHLAKIEEDRIALVVAMSGLEKKSPMRRLSLGGWIMLVSTSIIWCGGQLDDIIWFWDLIV